MSTAERSGAPRAAAGERDGAAHEEVAREELLARLRAFEGRRVGPPERAPDAVNQAMIRHWVEAVGDRNPVYMDPEAAAASVHGQVVAPPVMLQAWVMRGLRPRPAAGGTAQDELMRILDEAGFTSVVATNCEQDYDRYLHI
ncbi:MAG TPA: MaoC family dehydratase N-terminal domain-containing protein, partial [Acidimicrobiales bacterium]|nr:MaoC family dehydratase N-terminal domain-containing protein [Acidimicrobiales bacterium]